MSNRKFSQTDSNANHFRQVDEYARKLDLIYLTAIQEAVQIAKGDKVEESRMYSFDNYPQTRERIAELLRKLALQLVVHISTGQSSAWSQSNAKNDALVGSVLGTTALSRASVSRYNNHNLEALAAFQARKTAGLGLSERVFTYTAQFRGELEMALDIGLGEGRSAAQLSRDIRGYLQDPDKLFRRVRNKRGALVLSQKAANYHPGQGVYRSSYKNAMRLTRTEINSAYHEADRVRWAQLDFVVGYEVRRSNNITECDVCPSLAGKYPKTFVFRGWHSHCRCNAVAILATSDELRKLNSLVLSGQDPSGFSSSREVKTINPGFFVWIDRHQERLSRAKSLPYFITDNLVGFKS